VPSPAPKATLRSPLSGFRWKKQRSLWKPVDLEIDPQSLMTFAPQGRDLPSAAIMNQIRSIHRTRLVKRLGSLDPATMRRIDDAVKISLGLEPL